MNDMTNVNDTLPQRKRLRMEGYDYSSAGCYFVTIVTNDRQCLFGDVTDGTMSLNDAGKTIDQATRDIEGYDDNITVPFHVVMPNHVHIMIMQTGNNAIPEIIRRYKSVTSCRYIEGVKTRGWQRFDGNLWQKSYFDHIIRNQRAHDYIAQYIIDNPKRWNKDNINPHHDNDIDEILRHVIDLE